MARLLLVNFLWIDAEDEQHAHAAIVDAARPFKVEGTVGRVAGMVDDHASRDLYDAFMERTNESHKEIP